MYADGGQAEASTGYHVLATQLFALPFLVARSGGDEFSSEYARRLAAMFAWIACLSDDDGRLAHIGDCDDGRVELLPEDLEQMRLPLARRHSLHVASMLALGRALFPSTAKPHLASRSSVRVLPQSGAAVARVGSAEVTFLAMPNGLHGKGSHTHNDKLSLLLHVGNDELLCDSGTGCYTRDASLRNRLRATSAHSTLSVAGQEQNRMDGRHLFCLGNDAVPTPITATVEDDSVMLSASHSGYVRIGIVHTRSLQLSSGELLITDTLAGAGEHGFHLAFQIPMPPAEVAILRRGDTQTCRVDGLRELELCCTAPVGLELKKQESEISRVWCDAKRYPADGERPGTLPLKIVTRISWR